MQISPQNPSTQAINSPQPTQVPQNPQRSSAENAPARLNGDAIHFSELKGHTANILDLNSQAQFESSQPIEAPNGIYLADIPENDFETANNEIVITLEDQIIQVGTDSPDKQLKEIAWTPQNQLLAIEGPGQGTVTQGGDIKQVKPETGEKYNVLNASQMKADIDLLGSQYSYLTGHEARDLEVNDTGEVKYTVYMTDEMAENAFYVPMQAQLLDGELVQRQARSELSTLRSGGDITDGLNLSQIRVGQHEGYERIVFEVKQGGGMSGVPLSDAETSGHHSFLQSIRPDGSADLYIEFNGFRGQSYADIPETQYAKGIESWFLYDDSSLGIKIHLPSAGEFNIMRLENPARLVVDLKKSE